MSERLIGRVRYLVREHDLQCSPRATFDFLESVLKPHEDEWIASTPLSGGESLSIKSMLDDIVALRAATVSSLDP